MDATAKTFTWVWTVASGGTDAAGTTPRGTAVGVAPSNA